MFEFNKAHGEAAISSITFDSTGRRLITAGRDGAVRIWNYNNGHCLKSLERENCRKEVTDCSYVELNNNKYIIAVGWDHRINIFTDEMDEFHLIQRPQPHWPDDLRRGHTEDIVSVTFGRPNLLGTVSYDGYIIVWNIISGHSMARIPYPNIEPDTTDSSDDEEATAERVKEKGAVNKLAFLENRFLDKMNASLIAGCSDGAAIVWNINHGKAHARWRATCRKAGLSAMVVTSDCELLYVGDTLGFVSIWDIATYALRPLVQLSDGETSPKWSNPPYKVASWRCHVQTITCIEVIESRELVITTSSDYTARLWTNTGQFIGTYGQSTPWEIHDPQTWQHPMVPPEVLLDPLSLPEHPMMEKDYQFLPDSDDTDSDEEIQDLPEKKKHSVKRHSPRRSSSSWSGGSTDAWKRKLSRRLSRSSLITSINMYKDEEDTMLDEVRRSMRKSAGKRLRHEKLLAQQRHLQLSPSSHAFQSLQYFDLAEPPTEVTRPDPRAHIDDVFLIQEEDEEVDT
uniref:WD repeat-containing protein on Y chromosome-like n=1 Tax=Ciona intestinalis TaxID=7719 RepID=UPI00089DAD0A|nr:WD repeat-containing protein on Y chromosome-like [Ciona intestinalis]|eukprot:XP_002119618.2 WD repeat-containing protein on Y chromosome-like [Ciona intestinalis]